jgi:hypothetical protein
MPKTQNTLAIDVILPIQILLLICMNYELSRVCQGLMENLSQSVNDPFAAFTLAKNEGAEDGSYLGVHNIFEQLICSGEYLRRSY